jgi:hypothetical protein
MSAFFSFRLDQHAHRLGLKQFSIPVSGCAYRRLVEAARSPAENIDLRGSGHLYAPT